MSTWAVLKSKLLRGTHFTKCDLRLRIGTHREKS